MNHPAPDVIAAPPIGPPPWPKAYIYRLTLPLTWNGHGVWGSWSIIARSPAEAFRLAHNEAVRQARLKANA